MSTLSRLVALSTVAVLGFAGQALAHAHLIKTMPPDKATMAASPGELDLHFSEELNIKFSGVKITGPDKAEVKTGDARLMDEGRTLMVPLPETLSPGAYAVEWHVLSTDGHKTNGTYGFTVKP
ncbi:Cu resistance protein [Rhizobium sp. R72]|uniref:copper homeostasis periplasmic binding protein CopC n=1 Tax=unclassified Rhizobium TaxID=2613769 RepID=UPI000B5379C6|nr:MULTISPECIES: copper homeostasis periplasmic binding protein CopC [unclassified Rhizobium]OWV97437.1 Cu resistance protein [Rhizobium sp. R72]OWV97776.1 Cu resistance protein [Rhizobium sp. R711]